MGDLVTKEEQLRRQEEERRRQALLEEKRREQARLEDERREQARLKEKRRKQRLAREQRERDEAEQRRLDALEYQQQEYKRAVIQNITESLMNAAQQTKDSSSGGRRGSAGCTWKNENTDGRSCWELIKMVIHIVGLSENLYLPD